jgi:hypothetical protein
MNPIFILGLGLAAIDGLTSAFVAMLVLAMAVIGSGAREAPPDVSETAVFIIQKPAIRLLVSIAADTARPVVRAPRTSFLEERLSELEPYTNNGSVLWVNCDTCSPRLQINKPRSVSWRVCVASANTPGSFTESPLGSIKLKVSTITKPGETSIDDGPWNIADLWHAYEFNPTTRTLQKGDQSKCFRPT